MLVRRFLPALVVAIAAVAQPVAAQQAAPQEQKNAPAREVGTTSAQARAEFMSAIADVYNIFPERALKHFDRALELDPHYALARAIRANSAPGLTPEERSAQLDQAVAEAAAGPNQEVLNVLAWRTRDVQERRILLQALVAIAPKTATYAYRLAMTEPQGPTRIAALQRVALDFPDFAPVHNILAYMFWDTDHDAALREVQQYVQMLPDHPNPHDSYAELLQRSGRYQEALEHYNQAIAKAPDFAESYAGRAEVYQLTGKAAQARAEWQQAIAHELTANQGQHYTAIAGSYLLEGNRKLALAAVGDAMKTASPAEQGVGHALMAMIEGSGGNRAAARSHLAGVTANTPSAELWAGLAAVYSGDNDAARAAAGRAAQAGDPVAHVLNSILASGAGDVATAQQELQSVPAGADAAPLAKAFLAEALARTGHKTEARGLRDQVQAADVNILDDFALLRVRKL